MQTLPSDVALPDAQPQRLGPYVVVDTIGRGGSGVVYRAVAPDGSDVAVKTVSRASEWSLGSLRAEIHALRRVRHDGVVRVLDEGIDAGRPWFAMERVAGDTLAVHSSRLRPHQRADARVAWTAESLRPVLKILVRICEALAIVHESGIVHRDLKPDNVVLRNGDEPVIVDFGLAVENSPFDARAIPDASVLGGTAAYMAPEQLAGELVDARTDLFALGCIFFELLVGVPPSNATDSCRPSRFVDGVPERIDALVAWLLHPSARRRIGHAADVALCIQSAIEGGGEDAAEALRAGTLRQWFYRPALAGRAEMLVQVAEGLQRLRSKRGAFMVLLGESGIGKTHIASEIARRAAADATIIPAPSKPRAVAAAPLACWSKLLETATDRLLAQPNGPVALAIAKHLRVLGRLNSLLLELCRPSGGGLDATPSTPDEVFVALRDLLAAFASERPLVILLDDVQWADDVTLGVLRSLAGSSLSDLPVFFLATCRDDETSPAVTMLLDSPHVQRVLVGPLGAHDVQELVADMLGVTEPPEGVVAWVAHRAEGNPFLAAEYLRLVVSEVPMVRELVPPLVRVRPPPPESLAALPPPRSAHDLAGRRLDLLDGPARQVAELVALMGGAIDAAALTRLASSSVTREAIVELESRQLLRRNTARGAELIHDRIRMAAVERLDPDRRRKLHQEAAQVLTDAAEPPHGSIAYHLIEACMPADALPHLERAGELALSRAAYDVAARHFDDAREVAAELSRTGTTFTPLRSARREHGAARAHFGRGDLLTSEARVREVLASFGEQLPQTRVGWVAMVLEQVGAAALGRRAGGNVVSRDVLGELALAASLLPHRYFYEEDVLPVLGTSLLSANLARRAQVRGAVAPSSHLGAMAGLFRLTGLAERFFREAEQNGRANGQWRETAQALALESFHHAGFGRWRQAEDAATRAADACTNTTDPWMHENVQTTLAHVEFFTGRFVEARDRAARVAELARERQNDQHEIWGIYLQARSDIPRGRYASARPLLDAALARLAGGSETISRIACQGMLAETCLGMGELDRAELLAEAVLAEVRERLPSAYPTLVGYTGAASVLRHFAENAPSPSRVRAARGIAVALWRFSSLFPIAAPAAHLHAAHLLRIAGRSGLAHRVFVRGAAQAERLSMPYERAQLLRGAAATSDHVERSRALDRAGREILEGIGAA